MGEPRPEQRGRREIRGMALCPPRNQRDGPSEPDPNIEAERAQLLKEAEARDLANERVQMTISEEDDEKTPPDEEPEDVEMTSL